jgi:hypothetical protein
MSSSAGPPKIALRAAIVTAALGILVSLALLVQETPYTLVAFMFVGQPLLAIAFLLLAFQAFQDLRNRGVL